MARWGEARDQSEERPDGSRSDVDWFELLQDPQAVDEIIRSWRDGSRATADRRRRVGVRDDVPYGLEPSVYPDEREENWRRDQQEREYEEFDRQRLRAASDRRRSGAYDGKPTYYATEREFLQRFPGSYNVTKYPY